MIFLLGSSIRLFYRGYSLEDWCSEEEGSSIDDGSFHVIVSTILLFYTLSMS